MNPHSDPRRMPLADLSKPIIMLAFILVMLREAEMPLVGGMAEGYGVEWEEVPIARGANGA